MRAIVYAKGPFQCDEAASATAAGALRAGEKAGLPLRHYPLEAAPAAHDAVERGVIGKVLIDISVTP